MPNNAKSAGQLALEVDWLYYHTNPDRWREQWAAAVVEAEESNTDNEEAEEKKQGILDAIWREVRAVEAGTAERRLTDCANRPHEDYEWHRVDISDPDNRDRVQNVGAWVPLREAATWWPGPAPSLPAKYLVLAVFHDYGFRVDYPRILDPLTAKSGAVGDVKRWLLCDVGITRVSEVYELYEEGGPSHSDLGDFGLGRVETCLNAVGRDLEEESATGPTEAPKAPKPKIGFRGRNNQ
jgi:hypothetical protein